MGSGTGSDNRWQGYSHQQLYDMLHSGPGGSASATAAGRWSGLAGALADIQSDINTGVTASGATWVGDAADSARGALGPLGEWAQQASVAADVMRISTELQADLLGKARAAMPIPVPTGGQPAGVEGLAHLMNAQLDYEVAEQANNAAEQQAFHVMAQYEAGTNDNTSTLGEFGSPPSLAVDSGPIAAAAATRRALVTEPRRVTSRGPVMRGGIASEEHEPRTTARGTARTPAPTAGPSAESTAPPTETSAPPTRPSEASPTPAQPAKPPTSPSTTPADQAPSSPPPPRDTTPRETPAPPPAADRSPSSPVAPPRERTAAAATPNLAARGLTSPPTPTAPPLEAGKTGLSSARQDAAGSAPSYVTAPGGVIGGPGAGSTVGSGTFDAAMVPSARRPDEDLDEDGAHQSRYLLDAEDIYGEPQTYTPRVIGEPDRRR